MTPLEEIIREKIRMHGPLSIAEYMSLCLSHETYGYYMNKDPFGEAGDFTTAPEISQLFGEMIGAWLIDSWSKMGSPDPFILCECGPGRGTLMHDILRTAEKVAPDFLKAAEVTLLEMSPVLKQKQQEMLSGHNVHWVGDVKMIPDHAPVILIGNEFLDALPVRQFEYFDTGWHEKYIEINKNGTFHKYQKSTEMAENIDFPSMLFPPKVGDQVEILDEQIDFIDEVINIIKKQQGIALFIDYGFTLPSYGETLQAVKNHCYTDIFETPGLCDLTAHVNFAHLGEKILQKEMMLHGPVSQGDFLQRLGIEIRAGQLLKNATEQQADDIRSAMTRLTGHDTKNHQMGDLFKAMAFTVDPNLSLEGFA